MARKAFLHINGHDYELAQTFNGEFDPALQTITKQVEKLVSGSFASESFDVMLKPKQQIRLLVASSSVWAAAVYLKAEPKPAHVVRVR